MNTMNVSQEDAKESLSAVENVMAQTYRSITSIYVNPILMLWGMLWIIAFTITHFYYTYAFGIFMAMSIVGGIGTAVIFFRVFTKSEIKESSEDKVTLRIILMWVFLCVYIPVWLFLLKPVNGIQINAFICTASMFAYIVMGLWLNKRFMIVLGLALTAAPLVGFYL